MNIKLIFAFALGAIAGFMTKRVLDKRRNKEEDTTYEDCIKEYSGEDGEEIEQLDDGDYVSYSAVKDSDEPTLEKEETIEDPKIEVIDPKDFGLEDTFDTVSWTAYNGGIVCNEHDQIVEDKKSYIGDALDHMGEYEPDIVCVRNDIFRLYIEVANDPRDYSVAMGVKE